MSPTAPSNFYDLIDNWGTEDVAAWLRGLEDCVSPYVHSFIEKNVAGTHLLLLDDEDLEKIGVAEVGARRTVLLALKVLRHLCYEMETENLQRLAMKISVRARNLHNQLKHFGDAVLRNVNAALGWLPNSCLIHVTALADETKEIIGWLDRRPFDNQEEYVVIRNTLLCFSTGIIEAAREPSRNLTQTSLDIQMACTHLCAVADKVVQEFSDPLVLQTAYFDRAVVKRSNFTDAFGINIESTYLGVHAVSEVKFQSPADACGKFEPGDEIIQACGQTVVGWTLSKVANVMRQCRMSETPFLLKKPPRAHYSHSTPMKSTVETLKFQKKSVGTPPPPAKTRRRSSSMSVPRTPVDKVLSAIEPNIAASPTSVPFLVISANGEQSENNDGRPEGRRRRATVSGGSPTLKRLSSHLIRNTSVCPRPVSQWLYGAAEHLTDVKRDADPDDWLRTKLSKPVSNFRASLVDNRLYLPRAVMAKSTACDRLDDWRQALDDDVFDQDAIVTALAATRTPDRETIGYHYPMSGSDLKRIRSNKFGGESLLEEALIDELPSEARQLNFDEWNAPPAPVSRTNSAGEIEVTKPKSEIRRSTAVHKTRSYSGRQAVSTVPKNPFATLPRNSQNKLAKFFGESPGGSGGFCTWYDEETDPDSGSLATSVSQLSVASSSWSSKLSPKRSKVERKEIIRVGGKKSKDSSSEMNLPILTRVRRLTSSRAPSGLGDGRKISAPTERSSPKSFGDTTSFDGIDTSDGKNWNLQDLPLSTRLKLSSVLPCNSLGKADCDGWVLRARYQFEVGGRKWIRRWLVLQGKCLFIYRSPDDTKAEGTVWLPRFKVCPAAQDYKTTKKKWLQKLGLAAIGYNSSGFGYDLVNSVDSTGSGFYFPVLDDANANADSSSRSFNAAQADLLQVLKQPWRKLTLVRQNSNESSSSCHSEGALAVTSVMQRLTGNAPNVRDPLRTRKRCKSDQTTDVQSSRQ